MFKVSYVVTYEKLARPLSFFLSFFLSYWLRSDLNITPGDHVLTDQICLSRFVKGIQERFPGLNTISEFLTDTFFPDYNIYFFNENIFISKCTLFRKCNLTYK